MICLGSRRPWPELLILALAFYLRFPFPGQGWMHVDEGRFILLPLGFWSGDFNPHFFDYPTLQYYLASALYYVYFLLFGTEEIDSFIAYRLLVEADDLIFIARCLTTVMAVATVAVVMRLGSRLYGRIGGLMAGLILAVMLLHVRFSHLAATDVPAALWIALAVLWAVRITHHVSRWDCAVAGCFVGLAAATKYPGVLVGIPVLVAVLLQSRSLKQARLWVMGAAALVTFSLATPYVWLDFSHFWADLNAMGAEHLVDSGHQAGDSPVLHLIRHNLRYGLGFAGLLTAVLAVLWRPWRYRHDELVLLSAVIASALLPAMAQSSFMRYVVPLAPLMAVAMVRAMLGMKLRPLMLTLWIAAIVVEPAYGSLRTRLLLAGPDTRVQLKEWLDEHFPQPVRMIQIKQTSQWEPLSPGAINTRAFHFWERFGLEPAWQLLSQRDDLPRLFVFANSRPDPHSATDLPDSVSYFTGQFVGQRFLKPYLEDRGEARSPALLVNYVHPLFGKDGAEAIDQVFPDIDWVAEFSPGQVGNAVFDPVDKYFVPIGGWSGVRAVGPTMRLAVFELPLKEKVPTAREYFSLRHLLMTAEGAASEGRWGPALAGYGSIVSLPFRLDELLTESTRWALYHGLGVLHYRHGNSAAAIPLWEKSVLLRPAQPNTHFGLGMAHSDRGDHARAAASFRRAVELLPDDPEFHFQLGSSLIHLGQYESGIADLRICVELRPDPKAYARLGAAYSLAGEPVMARKSYLRALELDPNNSAATIGLNNFGNSEGGER